MKQVYLKSFFLSLLMMVIGNVGAFAAPGDEIKSPEDVVSGKSYYIKGVYTSSGTETACYYAPTDASGKFTGNAVTDINDALPITFTQVEGGWLLTTPNGYYVRPHTSNGQSYLVEDEVVIQLASGKTKEGENKGIKIGPYTNSGNDWYLQCNNQSAKIGGYKNTQYDVTLIECEAPSDASLTGISLSVDFVTDFYVYDEFTFGATVTAEYDDGSTKEVTDDCEFSGYNMSTPGDQTVTVSYTESGETVYASYGITVKDRTLMGLELSGDYPTEFNVGDTFSHEGLVVTANYNDGSSKDVTSQATISSPDMNTAGEQEVYVNYKEGDSQFMDHYTITVNGVAVTGITLDQEATILVGNTKTLTATIAPGNATDKSVTWTSSDESVATVADGVVTAVAEGTATITATANGGENISATCEVTVVSELNETTATGNLNNTDSGVFAGITGFTSGTHEISGTLSTAAGDVTVNYAGTSYSYLNDNHIRMYASGSTLKFTAPEGYEMTEIVFTIPSGNSANLDADAGSYSAGTWTGKASEVTFTGKNATIRLSAAEVTLKKEVTTTNAYTLVAGEEETPFEGLELTKELPAQTKFYVKDSNGNEYHSADAQSELIIIAENHENLPTTAEGKDFYLKKANTWVFTLTEGDEGALTLTVSPQTEGETTYMLSGYLQSSDDVFDENLKLTKEMTSTTEQFYFTRSDDYGLTNLTPANFNAPEDRRYWIFSEDAPTVDFIAGEIRGSYTVGETGLYTFSLDLTSKQVTATKIAKQYALVVGETEYPFDEQLTLTQELPAQTKFYVKDSEGNVYHSTDAQSEVIINAENHENLQTSTSPNNKNFYLSKANTWVFTLTEGEDGAVTLTVSPQTEGETKYMMTPDYAQESDDVFDANNQLTKEMTTEGFFIVRSDDYGLTNLTAAESNVQEGSNTYYIWEFSENAPTVGFIPGEIRNVFRMAEEGLYTFTLELENKTVTAETATEVTATGNLNNSDAGVFAGQQGYTSGAHSYTGTFSTALGDVTVDYAGSPNSYLNGSEIRMYGDKATLTLTAPNGYAFKEIVFTGTDIANLIADVGTYDADNKIWTGSGEKTETTVIFTSSESKKNLKTVTVTLEEAAPKSPLAGLRVEDYTKVDFLVGDAFEFDGKVIAIYEDETEKDVTDDTNVTFSGYDMDTAGEYQVTVSYSEGEVTMTTQYDILVREAQTVTFRKITSTDDLVSSERYVIVNEEYQKAMAEYYNYHFEAGNATISDERVTLVEGKANFLTLAGEEDAWSFETRLESSSVALKYLALTTSSNYLESVTWPSSLEDAALWTITFDADGNAVIQSNYKTDRYIMYNSNQPRFACYTGTQKPVQLYREVDEIDVDLTISSVGYATLYYSDRALKVPAGVTAKTYKLVDGKLTESKTYEAGKVIPQGEAVVLKGAAGNYTFFASSTLETPDADNQLKGSDVKEPTTGGTYYYALQAKSKDGKHGPGMYWMNSTGEAFENGAHKAYMALDEKFAEAQAVGGAKEFYLFDEATTGISGIDAASADRTEMYNLNGQRVNRGYKGVVIKNGKKIVIQ